MRCKEGLKSADGSEYCPSSCEYYKSFIAHNQAFQKHIETNSAMLRAESWQVQTFHSQGLDPDTESIANMEKAEKANSEAYQKRCDAENGLVTTSCILKQEKINILVSA